MTTINQHVPDFEDSPCSAEELGNVLSFLKHRHSEYRFNGDAKRELGRLIYNLKRNIEVKFRVGHGHTVRATVKNKMVAAELLLWYPGYHVQGEHDGVTQYSTITPTPLFFAAVNRFCQLKQGEVHVGYWEDMETAHELILFNEFMKKHKVTHAHGEVNTPLRFNYVPAESGQGVIRQRLIHGVQSIKKTVRPSININGTQVVQFDVKATHPQLLLHKYHRQPMTFDPYDIATGHKDEKPLRNAAKLALMMMLNNEKRASAGAAFRKKLREQDNEIIRTAVDRYTESQIKILDDVYERNPLLQEFFYRGMHRELMHMEGNIAWACMKRLAAQDIPSLNVHDEMIVLPQHLQEAMSVYKDCWMEETGAGIEPIITIKNCL